MNVRIAMKANISLVLFFTEKSSGNHSKKILQALHMLSRMMYFVHCG